MGQSLGQSNLHVAARRTLSSHERRPLRDLALTDGTIRTLHLTTAQVLDLNAGTINAAAGCIDGDDSDDDRPNS